MKMNLEEKIKNIFFTDVTDILEETQNVSIDSETIDEMMEVYLKNKRQFIDMFGGLSYTVPEKVQFTLTEEEKEKYFEELYNRIQNSITGYYNQDYDTKEILKFVSFCEKSFFDNAVPEKYSDNIPKGMKITRAFNRFDLPEYTIRQLQDIVSEYLQKGMVEGYLTISVDPRDYLTMSDNEENWTSCMSTSGMYRRGTLSYMLDRSTVVCYISNGKNKTIRDVNIDWNSKKWRMLIHFSSNFNAMFCSRQYPFYSLSGLKIVKEKILDNFYGKDNLNDDFTEIVSLYSNIDENKFNLLKKEKAKGYILYFRNLIDDIDNQYSDVIYVNHHNPVYYIERKPEKWNKTEEKESFYIGEYTPCLYCGEWQSDVNTALNYTMFCNDCELMYGEKLDEDNIAMCDFCGEYFIVEDDNTICTDYECYKVCYSCLDKVKYCDCCDAVLINDDETYYDSVTDRYYCEECYVELLSDREEDWDE